MVINFSTVAMKVRLKLMEKAPGGDKLSVFGLICSVAAPSGGSVLKEYLGSTITEAGVILVDERFDLPLEAKDIVQFVA